MRPYRQSWAVVLAAGDGTRLASLTTDSRGNAVPKQFCSLHGESSLLQDALQRARAIAPRERLCVIVAERHRTYWQEALWSLPERNVVVQPRNCGTAHGILLAVLHILVRDPQAHVVFLPADHYVRDEAALARGLETAAALTKRNSQNLLLLGIEPDEPDPELGYIVPGERRVDGSRAVLHFVEKPQRELARELMGRGALWNSFIFAAHGAALLELLRARLPETVAAMARAVGQYVRDRHHESLSELYSTLETVDFSRAIVQGAEARLRVVTAAACGWTDLGTPQRVIEALQRPLAPALCRRAATVAVPALINLARQHARLQRTA